MGYVKATEYDTLTLPSDSAYYVKMKRKASFGDISAAQSAMLHLDAEEGKVSDVEWSAYITELAAALIAEWNITDENEQPLTVTAENLKKLDAADGQFIAAEASKRSGLRSPKSGAVVS